MSQFVYDGSFTGLLTALFETFERKMPGASIVRRQSVLWLIFGETVEVVTNDEKAGRVLSGLRKKTSPEMFRNIYVSFLSEQVGIESVISRLVACIFLNNDDVSGNFGNSDVLTVAQTAKKVAREKHRFEAFIRFELIDEDVYYAQIDPDHNILPLILPHFKNRYADQHWVIYDTRRSYGIHYDKLSRQVCELLIDFTAKTEEGALAASFDHEEREYQQLWRGYFKATNILSRKNPKLHLQHLPRRYWKYLTEKQQ